MTFFVKHLTNIVKISTGYIINNHYYQTY